MKKRYLLAIALYCAAIFYVSAQPDVPDLNDSVGGGDKIGHFIAYGGLAALVAIGLRRSPRNYSRRRLFWIPLVVASLYGLSDEIHQIFVPNRSFDPRDLVADVAGALLGVALCFLVWRFAPQTKLWKPSAVRRDGSPESSPVD